MILFSFRRCPYAISARLALQIAQVPYQLIDVDLKNKPPSLHLLSPKATVPVAYWPQSKKLLDQSRHIVTWALEQYSPTNWLDPKIIDDSLAKWLNQEIDILYRFFVPQLNTLKYTDDHATLVLAFQSQLALFQRWETLFFSDSPYAIFKKPCFIDIIFLPIIRQWCRISSLPPLKVYAPKMYQWLEIALNKPIWQTIMAKLTPDQIQASAALERKLYHQLTLSSPPTH